MSEGKMGMKLSGFDVAKSEKPLHVVKTACAWCETVVEIPLGPQHVHGVVDAHCGKCGKFFSTRVADDWFDAHDKKLQDEREVWKRIPPEAYLTCRRGMAGAAFVYTLYLGKGDPTEYQSRDSVEHFLVKEFDMSWYQANAIINSSVLDPGRKIYFQRLTKISAEIASRERKVAVGSTVACGTPVRFNGYDGIFLRASHNEGFGVVALNGFGDTEIPMIELEVMSVSTEPEFETEASGGALQEVENLEKKVQEQFQQVENVEHKIQDAIQELGGDVAAEPSDSPDVGEYEEQGAEVAPSQTDPEDEAPAEVEFESEEAEGEEEDGDLVVSFDGDEGDEKEAVLSVKDLRKDSILGLVDLEKTAVWPFRKERPRTQTPIPAQLGEHLYEGKEPKKPQFAKGDRAYTPIKDEATGKRRYIELIITEIKDKHPPMGHWEYLGRDPNLQHPARWYDSVQLMQGSEEDVTAAGANPEDRLNTLQSIINDPNTDPDTLQKARKQFVQEKGQMGGGAGQSTQSGSPAGTLARRAWWYKTPNELGYSRYPKDVSHPDDGSAATKKSDLFPKKDESYPDKCKDPNVEQHDVENSGAEHSARVAVNRGAQRKVHVHYQNSQDLKRAISVNREDLGIEDIRYILSHYHHIGHLARHDADNLADWFIGTKPRLLCASDVESAVQSRECLNCGACGETGDKGLCNRCQRRGSRVTANPNVRYEWDDDDSNCPQCGGQPTELGGLGNRNHYRCRDCGWDWSKEASVLSDKDIVKQALLGKGMGIFTPALYKGKEVLIMAIDNTGAYATIQSEGGKQTEVEVRDLKPTNSGPYSGENDDSYTRTRLHAK
jgi:hypothetical protein